MTVLVDGSMLEIHAGSWRGSMMGIALEKEAKMRGVARVDVLILKTVLNVHLGRRMESLNECERML